MHRLAFLAEMDVVGAEPKGVVRMSDPSSVSGYRASYFFLFAGAEVDEGEMVNWAGL